jgi:hypothetical protein
MDNLLWLRPTTISKDVTLQQSKCMTCMLVVVDVCLYRLVEALRSEWCCRALRVVLGDQVSNLVSNPSLCAHCYTYSATELAQIGGTQGTYYRIGWGSYVWPQGALRRFTISAVQRQVSMHRCA